MSLTWRLLSQSLFVFLVLSLVSLSCKQYEYVSPEPGILEVRLRTLVNDPEKQRLIPFAAPDSLGQVRNAFMLLLKSIRAIRPDGSEQELFSDLSAIRRNPDGDFFNCLDVRARDSVWILGKSYFPPSDISQLWITVTPTGLNGANSPPIIVVTGLYSTNIIQVRMPVPTPLELQQLSTYGQGPLSTQVEENRRTVVTITFDLDQSLVRRAEWYEYHPTFYITSIEQF